MNIPKPERIKIDKIDKPIEDLIYDKRDILYPKLLEIIRYCKKTKEVNITFLEIETGNEILSFNIGEPYNEQITNCIKYFESIEEYEICQELKSYLS